MIPPSYTEYRDTPLWRAIASALAELEANREMRIETAPDYVIDFMCRELTAKGVVEAAALTRRR